MRETGLIMSSPVSIFTSLFLNIEWVKRAIRGCAIFFKSSSLSPYISSTSAYMMFRHIAFFSVPCVLSCSVFAPFCVSVLIMTRHFRVMLWWWCHYDFFVHLQFAAYCYWIAFMHLPRYIRLSVCLSVRRTVYKLVTVVESWICQPNIKSFSLLWFTSVFPYFRFFIQSSSFLSFLLTLVSFCVYFF